MVTIKHKVTLKTKTPQEETSESVDVKKVTLKKKHEESSAISEQRTQVKPEKDTNLLPQEPEKSSNTGKIIGGIVAAAVIIAAVYFFGIRDNDNSGDDKTVASTEVVAQNVGNTVKETTANSSAAGEEGLTENSSEATTPANDSETSAENAKNAPTANESASSSVQTDDKKTEEKSAITPSVSSVPSTVSSVPVSGDVEENARRVIRGDFGNGQVRKDKLGKAYSEIQGRVNEMYRQGLVK